VTCRTDRAGRQDARQSRDSSDVLADSIDELAAKIVAKMDAPDSESDLPRVHELTSRSTVDDLIAAFLRESVEYSTRRQRNDA